MLGEAWTRSSHHTYQHAQPSIDVLERETVGGGWEASGVGDRDEEDEACVQSSLNPDQNG